VAAFLVGLVGVMAVSVAALGTVTGAHSQATFSEGAFVQGQDGTRWVVGNGRRFRLAFVSDDAGLLPTLPEGSPVATVCEAAAAVAGTDPVACAASGPAPAAPAPPADSSILLDARGGYTIDLVRTETFTLSTRRVMEICWELADPAPPPGGSPLLELLIYESGSDRQVTIVLVDQNPALRENGCWPRGEVTTRDATLAAGTYYLRLISFFRSWRVIVRAR
jgi:hypothetical protein